MCGWRKCDITWHIRYTKAKGHPPVWQSQVVNALLVWMVLSSCPIASQQIVYGFNFQLQQVPLYWASASVHIYLYACACGFARCLESAIEVLQRSKASGECALNLTGLTAEILLCLQKFRLRLEQQIAFHQSVHQHHFCHIFGYLFQKFWEIVTFFKYSAIWISVVLCR